METGAYFISAQRAKPNFVTVKIGRDDSIAGNVFLARSKKL